MVASSSAGGQIHWRHPEIPIEQWTTTPPLPTALGQQFSASTAALRKKVPSLQHCLLSDGGLDVEKYLQRQVTTRECSLWRTSTALNLIHGVGESLTAGDKAHSLAPGIKKTWAPRCVYGRKESADSELQVMKPNECQWWGMYVNNHLILEDSSMQTKFRVRFQIPYSNYLELLQWIRDNTRFARWCGAKSKKDVFSDRIVGTWIAALPWTPMDL